MNPDDGATSRPGRTGRLIVLGSIVVMALAAWLLVHIEKNNAGGLSEQLFATIFGEDTEYAPAYTERAFVKLQLGSDEPTVMRELGEPLLRRATKRGITYWYYSHSPGSNNYRVRSLALDRGRVTQKRASYYWD